ncbi:Type 1 glutamine amidotransferase-like domain-containing protein [Arthrobacter sp. CG_A4]|uniref:Type 1 glutamine amidotransferase-like domain-containing protein n=1 Tax=Arthrobacter sp. CG_A4 TaxID=3071706 RepID=UPI002DFB9F6A|nr:peptidase E [Arthrobacter sp. CG_A4]
MLRAALARSGADALTADRLRADELVYAGFSAGVCVLAPSLLGLEECDSTEDALSMYGAVEFEGLSILDRSVVPHLGSPEHPESEALTRVAAAYTQERKPFWALRDGQACFTERSPPGWPSTVSAKAQPIPGLKAARTSRGCPGS